MAEWASRRIAWETFSTAPIPGSLKELKGGKRSGWGFLEIAAIYGRHSVSLFGKLATEGKGAALRVPPLHWQIAWLLTTGITTLKNLTNHQLQKRLFMLDTKSQHRATW